MKCILGTLVIICLFKIDSSLAKESQCTLRSQFGDMVYNVSNGVHCGRANLNEVDLQTCPEEAPTFLLEENCCTEDQNECNLAFAGEGQNMIASLAIPVVFITNPIGYLKIIQGTSLSNCTQELAKVFDRRSSETVTDCSVKTSELEGNVIIESNGTVLVNLTDINTTTSGIHRISLQCNQASGSPSEECLVFKLITSLSQAVCNFRDLDLPSRSNIGQCESGTTSTTAEHPTTIWEKYSQVLVFIVVGAGCSLGMIFILVIIVCLLAGCVINNKRRKVRVHHKLQLETVANLTCTFDQGRRSRDYVQGPKYTPQVLHNCTPEETMDNDSISLTAQITTKPHPTPLLVKVEAPAVPQVELKIDKPVTFESFKCSSPKKAESEVAKKAESEVAKKAESEMAMKAKSEVASKTELDKLASVDPEVYYERILPVWKSEPKQNPTETYDTLVHKGVPTGKKHLTLLSSDDHGNQYSHLGSKASSLAVRHTDDPDGCFSLQVLRRSRSDSLTPPPLPPPLTTHDLEELMNPLRKDAFESSWSHPHTIDRNQPTIDLVESIYDHPTGISSKTLQHTMDPKVENDKFEEPIYDLPPFESPDDLSPDDLLPDDLSPDDLSDSYVDMEEGLSIKLSFHKENKLFNV